MATGNAEFDGLFKRVIDAVNKPEEEYPWVNCPTPPITEPVKERTSDIPKVAPVRSGFEIYFPAPSSVESIITRFYETLSA